ncbi:hypothetical protein HD806DRAFT_541339 [Xylariaceae sp. AK1471]|nr:hypothetical protein HD806DRAFT_541339 [Xylariaceae sp. AK1471]
MALDRTAAAAVVDLANKPQSLKEYVADLKSRTFNRYSWDTMLIAAPVCLELLGSCETVASSEWAGSVVLEPPSGEGFIFFKQTRLKGALAEINNQGRGAFINARERMAEIYEAAKVVRGVSTLLVRAKACYIYPASSIALGARELNKGKDLGGGDDVETPRKQLKRLNDQYEDLIDPALERSEKSARLPFLALRMKSLESNKKRKTTSSSNAGGKTKKPKIGGTDKQRSGGKGGKGGGSKEKDPKITGSGTSSIEDALDKLNGPSREHLKKTPEIGLDSIEEALKKLNDKDQSGADDSSDDDDSSSIGDDRSSGEESGQGESSLEESEDEDGGKKAKSTFTLDTVELLLSRELSTLKSDPESFGKPSTKSLLNVISLARSVISGIQAEAKKAKGLKDWKQPAKTSSTVKGWVKTVDQCIAGATKLTSTSKRRAGTHTGRAPVLFTTNPAAEAIVKARTDLTRAMIENSRNQLEIQLQTYRGSQNDYMKATDRVIDIQEKLANIRKEIAEYGQNENKLSEVREVRDLLRSCIAFLIDLRQQLEILMQFFSSLALLVKSAVTKQVKPFSTHVKNAAQSLEDTHEFNRYLLNVIYKYAISIAANFDLYQDIASMYTRIHDEHIRTGLNLVDEMSQIAGNQKLGKSTPEEKSQIAALFDSKKKALGNYAKDAQTSIRSIVKDTGDNIHKSLTDRVKKIDDVLQQLENLGENPTIKEAIEDGEKEVKQLLDVQMSTKSPVMDYIAKPKRERIERVKADRASSNTKCMSMSSDLECKVFP